MIRVLGDFIRDVYIHGSVERISPEGPFPVFVEERRQKRDGGAGNVYANLLALGSKDAELLSSKNSKKTRYVVDNVVMFRRDKDKYVANEQINYDWTGVDYCILSDYNKGYLHELEAIIESAKSNNVKVVVDVKKPVNRYAGVDILKLNNKELKTYAGIEDIRECDGLRKKYGFGAVVVTMGQYGVYVSSEDFSGIISSDMHQVSDVTGAGDVFIASMTHYLDTGLCLYDSCKKANILAGISVTKFGTYVLNERDIRQVKTVFTNGCFDILHHGHIDYLKKSRELGAKLIVGLNSDESVKRLKGCSRPINNQYDRKRVLEALECVDEVVIFDDETPIELIKKLRPDVLTKGGDYTNNDMIVGSNIVNEVHIIPFLDGYSTTSIIERAGRDSL